MANNFSDYFQTKYPEGASTYTFVQEALYAPQFGYYRKDKVRVGKATGTDFYTSPSLGSVFEELIVGSIEHLLPNAKDHTLYLIGAEPNASSTLWENYFKAVHYIGINESLDLSGQAVVLANELLDAQPFHSYQFNQGQWQERYVKYHNNQWEYFYQKPTNLPSIFPEQHLIEGYQLDYPSGSNELLERITQANWQGLMIILDYGLSWNEILGGRPEGTARTYYRHELGSDLLARPSEEDITHHICWDHTQEILHQNGLSDLSLKTQERFFMATATEAIERIIQSHNPSKTEKLKELISPGFFGKQFEVLVGKKP